MHKIICSYFHDTRGPVAIAKFRQANCMNIILSLSTCVSSFPMILPANAIINKHHELLCNIVNEGECCTFLLDSLQSNLVLIKS